MAIERYNEFLNETLKKEFRKLLRNITSYFGSEDDIEKLEADLIRLLTTYKNKIVSGEIRKIDNQFIDGVGRTRIIRKRQLPVDANHASIQITIRISDFSRTTVNN